MSGWDKDNYSDRLQGAHAIQHSNSNVLLTPSSGGVSVPSYVDDISETLNPGTRNDFGFKVWHNVNPAGADEFYIAAMHDSLYAGYVRRYASMKDATTEVGPGSDEQTTSSIRMLRLPKYTITGRATDTKANLVLLSGGTDLSVAGNWSFVETLVDYDKIDKNGANPRTVASASDNTGPATYSIPIAYLGKDAVTKEQYIVQLQVGDVVLQPVGVASGFNKVEVMEIGCGAPGYMIIVTPISVTIDQGDLRTIVTGDPVIFEVAKYSPPT